MISNCQKDESPLYKPFGLRTNMGMGMTMIQPKVKTMEGDIKVTTDIFVVDKRFKEGSENRLSDFKMDLNEDVAVLREMVEERYEALGVKLPKQGYVLTFKNSNLMRGVSLKNQGVKHWSDICIESKMMPTMNRMMAFCM